MGILIIAALAIAIGYPFFSRWLDRQASRIERTPDAVHRAQMMRWVAGRGPDPREVLFCNGVPVEQNEAPELSSLSWPPPLALAPKPTRTTGTSTVMVSSTATIPG